MVRIIEIPELMKMDSPLMKPIEITSSSAFMSKKSLYLVGALIIVTLLITQKYRRKDEETALVRPEDKWMSVREFLDRYKRLVE